MGNAFSNTALFRPTEPSYTDELENLIFIPELLDINVAKFWDDETFEIFSKKENVNELRQKKFPALFFYYSGENKTRHTIIYFHSNSCDLGQVYDELEILHKHLHANILAIEFVGFGLCYLEGTASQYNINRRALAAYNFLRALNIKSKNILLFGRSIGTGAATKLARNLKLMNHEIGGVILHSPYISIKALVEDYISYSSYLIENIYDNYENLKAVSNNDKSDTPLLIIHGNEDEIIPVSHSKYMMSNLQNMYKNASYPNESYHNYYYVIDDLGIPIKTFLHTLSKSKFAPNTDIYLPKQFLNKHDLSIKYKISTAKGPLDIHESNTRHNGKTIPLGKKIVAKSNLGSNTNSNTNSKANSKTNSKANSKANSNFNTNVRDGEKDKNKQKGPSNISTKEKKKKKTEREVKNEKYNGLFTKQIDYGEENINEIVMHKNKEKNLTVYDNPKISCDNEKQQCNHKQSEGHAYDENKINIKVIKENHIKELKTQSATNKSNNIISFIKKGSNGYCFSETSIKKCKNTVPELSVKKGMNMLFDKNSKYNNSAKTASRFSSKTSKEASGVNNEKSAQKDKNKQILEQEKIDKERKKGIEMERNKDSKQVENQIKEKEEAKKKHILENQENDTNKIKEHVHDNKKNKAEKKSIEKEKIQHIANLFQNEKISFCQNGQECFNLLASSSNYACHKKSSNQKRETEKEKMGTNSLQLGKPQNENEEERKMKKIEIEGRKIKMEKGLEKEKEKKLEETYKMNKVYIETEAKEKKKTQQVEENNYKTFNSKINKAKEKVSLVLEALNKSKYITEMQLLKKKQHPDENRDNGYSYHINKSTNCESHVNRIVNEENVSRETLREQYAINEQEQKLENAEKNDNKKNILKMENNDINENEYTIKEFSYYIENNIINKDKIKDFIDKVMDNFHEEEAEEENEDEDGIHNDDEKEKKDNTHNYEKQEESDISDTEKKQTELLKEIMIEKSAENQKREDTSFE